MKTRYEFPQLQIGAYRPVNELLTEIRASHGLHPLEDQRFGDCSCHPGSQKDPRNEHLLADPEKSLGTLGRRVRLGALWCMLRWEQCLRCVADGCTKW